MIICVRIDIGCTVYLRVAALGVSSCLAPVDCPWSWLWWKHEGFGANVPPPRNCFTIYVESGAFFEQSNDFGDDVSHLKMSTDEASYENEKKTCTFDGCKCKQRSYAKICRGFNNPQRQRTTATANFCNFVSTCVTPSAVQYNEIWSRKYAGLLLTRPAVRFVKCNNNEP